ncbi:MAG: hypothetical protein QM754_20300 [Tepidisphaeraceae bacterium]
MQIRRIALLSLSLVAALPMMSHAALEEGLQKKVDAEVAAIRAWASDPAIVDAVKRRTPPRPPNTRT